MKTYLPIEMPENCSDCPDWNCDKAKPRIPKDCPIVQFPTREKAEKIINRLWADKGNMWDVLDQLGFKEDK